MPNLRLAFRTLSRSPFVTVFACLSLAMGIGATSAIFSLFEQMVLRPLPVAEPDRLVNLAAPGPKPGSQSCSNAGDCDHVFSYPMFRDLEAAAPDVVAVAAHRGFGANLAYRGQSAGGDALLVSGGYFPALGLRPAVGRLLGPDDNRTAGAHPVVVLAHDYWQSRFGASASVVGESLVVNGQTLTIVGVAPAGFAGTTLGTRPRVFVPMVMREILVPGFKGLEERRSYWAYLFGRLAPGATPDKAASVLNSRYRAVINDVEAPLQQGMSEDTLARFRAKTVEVSSGAHGQSSLRRSSRAPLLLLLGATAFVLAIACANVANLLLARAANRSSEIAVRLSLGAGRRQMVAQLLAESCLLALGAGLGGLLFAGWTLELVGSILPTDTTTELSFRLELPLLAFTAALTLGTGVLFGLFPALDSTRPDLASNLKGQSNRTSGSLAATRFRTALVTGQIGLAMALLVSAGLFTKSLVNVSRVDLGLETDQLVAFSVAPELSGYPPARSRELFERMEGELSALPGITHVAASMVPLISGNSWGNSVSVQGFEAGPDTDTNSRFNEVGTGFFSTLGIPLLAGRDFTTADVAGAPKVAIVNEAFARKFNLGREAVGKLMATERGANVKLDIEIVGLVADAKYSDVKQEVPPQFFTPYRQDDGLGYLNFYVRTSLPAERMVAVTAEVMRRLDPDLPIEDLQTMTAQVEENVYVDRLIGRLSAAFAVLATLLAAVGLYGVLAYTVAQRTREIGLRMALGADSVRIRTMVLRQVGWMTLAGGVLGVVAALGLARVGRSLLFELEGHDPGILAGAGILLAVVALVAGLIPAARASRIEPMQALRHD